ncbi:MAG: hypothetical protein Q9225_006260 [Loekoesia sp. 1 TL-2023]
MSFEVSPTDPSGVYRSRRKHTFHRSEPTGRRSSPLRSGSDYDSERVRIDYERLRIDPELSGREVRREEYEKRERERSLAAQTERTKREQDHLVRDRELILAESNERIRTEQDRLPKDRERIVAEQKERIRRDQDRSERDRELIRREQELLQELSSRDRERMERDPERGKLSRKDRRTNSGRTILEPKQSRVERTSSGLSAPIPEEPKSLLSRLSSLFPYAPATKAEVAPKSDAAPRIDATSKIAKSVPQSKTVQSTSEDLEGYFLQPVEDSYIQKSVASLSDSIDQHVYNHYENQKIGPPYDVFLRIVQIDDGDLCLPKSFIGQESFRLAAIRRSIANAMIKDISIDGNPSTTFLPREIVSLLTMVPAHNSEKFRFLASSVFRRTAANLLRLCQSGESPAYIEFRRMQVKKASDGLHKRLSALASPDSSEAARRDQLEAIMTKAAQIGMLLLLQPETHQFDWYARFSAGSSFDDQGKAKSWSQPFVIFPALIRTGDSMGRKLRRPQLICKPEYLDDDDLAENESI